MDSGPAVALAAACFVAAVFDLPIEKHAVAARVAAQMALVLRQTLDHSSRPPDTNIVHCDTNHDDVDAVHSPVLRMPQHHSLEY